MYEGKELLKSEIEKISAAKNLIINYDKLDLDIFPCYTKDLHSEKVLSGL
jgi:hypothetical protein